MDFVHICLLMRITNVGIKHLPNIERGVFRSCYQGPKGSFPLIAVLNGDSLVQR